MDQRVAFFKELYFFEMARKDQINASIGLPIALATSLAAVVAYYIRNWPSSQLGVFGAIFLLLAIPGAGCLVCAFCCLVRVLWGTVYEWMPTALDLWRYHEAVAQHYEQHPDLKPPIDEWLATQTAAQLADCAATNDAANCVRVNHRVLAVRWLLAAVILFALAMVPYSALTLEHRGPLRVQIEPGSP